MNEFRSGVGVHWPFLSDPGRTIQKDLDIAENTDPGRNTMIPRLIVLETGLVTYKSLQPLLVLWPVDAVRTPARRQ